MWTTWQKSGWGVTCLKWVPESRVMGKSDGYFQMWRMGGFLLWNLDSVQHQTSQLKSIQKFYPKILSKNSIQKFYPKIYPKFYPKNPSTNLSNNVKNGEIPSLTSGLVAPPNFPVAIHPKGITGGPMNVYTKLYLPQEMFVSKNNEWPIIFGMHGHWQGQGFSVSKF